MNFKLCEEFYYRITDENEDIYKLFNTSPENVLRNNPQIKFYPGELVKIRKNDYIVHNVKPMQTLNQISKLYGVSEEEIKQQNNILSNKLFIGQQIKIYENKKAHIT